MSAAIDTFLYSLVALLVIIDPAGTAALFIGMTPHDTQAERAEQAIRACVVAFVVLTLFGLGGGAFLGALGITIPALKLAGGILLFITAADMVTARGLTRASSEERAAATRTENDISVFPLAIPLIAGPGAMTTMVLLQSHAGTGVMATVAIQAALLVATGATLAALLMARYVARLLGDVGANVIGRVLGVVLAALAAQFAIEGVRESFGLR